MIYLTTKFRSSSPGHAVICTVLVVFGVLGVLCPSGETGTYPLEGQWYGEVLLDKSSLSFQVQFSMTANALEGEMYFYKEDITLPFTLATDSRRLRFDVQSHELGRLEFEGPMNDSLILGSVKSDGPDRTFFIRRLFAANPKSEAACVGWYVGDDGSPRFVTFRAQGGLTFYDFDGLSVGSRFPVGNYKYVRLDDSGRVDLVWAFMRTADDSVDRIVITDAGGDRKEWPRLAEPPFAQQEVSWNNGQVTLSGLLLQPKGARENVAVYYIHGSGPNNTRNNFYDLWVCQYLASRGITVLIPDKRGSGKSGGDWRTGGFEDRAHDAIAGVEMLRSRSDMQDAKVGVMGFSQGGWIAPAATALSDDVAFVVDVSGSSLKVEATVAFEMEQRAREAGLDDDGVAQILKLQAAATDYMFDKISWDEYKSALDAAMSREWPGKKIAQGYPQTPWNWKWAFHRRQSEFQPLDYWREVRVPALVIYGSEDTQLPVEASVDRLKSVVGDNLTIKVFQGSGHAIGDSSTGWVRQEYLDLLVDWIHSQAK